MILYVIFETARLYPDFVTLVSSHSTLYSAKMTHIPTLYLKSVFYQKPTMIILNLTIFKHRGQKMFVQLIQQCMNTFKMLIIA